MSNQQKLELTWIGKEKRPKLEPHILLKDSEKSYHAKHRVSDNDIFDNRLIFGDNLLALKALEAEFSGKVKCVFIDPPYNTGSAFTHYDDDQEQEIKAIDRQIKEVRRTAATAPMLEDELTWQKQQRELEGKRSKLRRELFARQDEVEARRNEIISQLEAQLEQRVEERMLFTVEWELR